MNKRIFLFIFCLLPAVFHDAQADSISRDTTRDTASRFARDTSSMPVHSFDKRKWQTLRKSLVYKDKPDKPDSVVSKSSSSGTFFNFETPVARDLFVILIAGVIIVVLIAVIRRNLVVKKKEMPADEISIEEATADTDEMLLLSLLEKSLERKNFREAIRAYYLLVLHRLNKQGWIRWKKNKTNRQYLAELRSRPSFDLFREITRIYEFSWYGSTLVEENTFIQYQPAFTDFLETIKVTEHE